MDHEMEFEIRQAMTALMGIASMLKPFYDTLIKSGFSEPQAIILTGQFMEHMIPKPETKGKQND